MSRTCKACGVENRDEAKFCRGCGSPLPQRKLPPRDPVKEAAVRKFWLGFFLITAAVAAVGAVIYDKLSFYNKMDVIKQYTSKYDANDDRVFGTIKPPVFFFEGLSWNMTSKDIKKIYQYATDSTDPDFYSSITIPQSTYAVPVPHADFMSLGMFNDRLYAIKLEFGPLEQFQAQALKVPDREEIMYARFRGLYNIFVRLFGHPAFEKNEVKKFEVLESINLVKVGRLPAGEPSNIYVMWDMGDTRAELVLFGLKNKIHLTTRFLYAPVWKEIGKQ